MSNEIVLENQKPGNPESQWGLPNGASSSIEGFTSDISTDVGGYVEFKIDTDATRYRIDIYRLGYYGGNGARLVDSIEHTGAAVQPAPIIDLSRATVDAGNWSVTDAWIVPSDAVSGVYIAKLVREDGTPGENHIPFIVRDDEGGSDILFQTSDTTWQAYNDWGGASLYGNGLGTDAPRATAVSYNRPVGTTSINQVLAVDYSAIRWLEQNGYDVSYSSGVDTDRNGQELLEHKLFLSVGHDEYWSGDQRANVEAARDAGVNLAFWSGNEVFWKTRWEPSLDSNPDDYRTLVTYKETKPDSPSDPSPEWTGTWRDARNAGGSDPENSLTGTIYMVDASRADTIRVSSDFAKLRFWANTDIAHLASGQSVSLSPGTLGYEWDIDWDNGFRPAGLINLSSTTVNVNSLLNDPWTMDGGAATTTGDATHSLTLYRADSGALVFSAGTVFWSWALDPHNPGRVPEDHNVQQSMVNLFAEMGIQPETLHAGLIPAVQSDDDIAPTASINNSSGIVSSQILITGTAQDFGGGVVAGVEFSGDGLAWHKATGLESWSYALVPDRVGTYAIAARAVDDSLNLGSNVVAKLTVDFQHPGFDPGFYLAANPDVKASGIDPYEHYITNGWHELRDPNIDFSTYTYLNLNPDVAASGMDPLTHFETYGWLEGRNPSSGFDTELYLATYPDVDAAGLNPLNHYLVYGMSEGRSVLPGYANLFDATYYLSTYPEVAAANVNPFTDYSQNGVSQNRNPNPYFDTAYYLNQSPEVAASGLNPLEHYDTYGWKEGLNPSAQFDTTAYLSANPDVAASGMDPLLHYLQYGMSEGRDPHGIINV